MNGWLVVVAALMAWMLAGVLLASAIGPSLRRRCDDASAQAHRPIASGPTRWVEPVRWVVPACIAAMAVASSTGLAAAGVLPAPVQVAARSMFNTVGVEIPDAPGRTGGGGDETVESADATPSPTTAAPGPAGADQPAGQGPQRLGETPHDGADTAAAGPTGVIGEVGGVSSGAPVLDLPGRRTAPSKNPAQVPSTATTLVEAPPEVAVTDDDVEQAKGGGKGGDDVGVPQEKVTPAPPLRGPAKGVGPGAGPEIVDDPLPPVALDLDLAPPVLPFTPDLVPAPPVPSVATDVLPTTSLPPAAVTGSTILAPPVTSRSDRVMKGGNSIGDKSKRRDLATADVPGPPSDIAPQSPEAAP